MLTLFGNILMVMAGVFALLLLLPLAWYLTRINALGTLCEALAGLFDGINRQVAHIAKWSVLLMALIQVSIVMMRYIFGINFIWLQESIIYLFGASFLLTAGYALLIDEHVRVDIFYREASERFKARVDMFGTYAFLFPICVLLVWAAGPYVGRAWAIMEGSQEISGIQAVFILKSFIPAFAILLAMAGFTLVTKAAGTLTSQSKSEAA
jgi:TRAP-type mannitol/chloroaromatic compound transport system permease small subunit